LTCNVRITGLEPTDLASDYFGCFGLWLCCAADLSYSLPTQCSVVVVQGLLTAATYAVVAAVATGFLQCMNSINSGVCCSSSRGPQFGHFDGTSVFVLVPLMRYCNLKQYGFMNVKS